MNLYEIDKLYEECFDLAIDENGEIKDNDLFNFLDEIGQAKEQKIENIGIYYKNLLSNAEQLKKEKDSLAERQKVFENKAERLKLYLQSMLNPGEKFETSKVKISWRKSEQVQIDCDVNFLPSEFQKIKIEPDKTGIKNRLKEGIEINHCSLIKKDNIQIK